MQAARRSGIGEGVVARLGARGAGAGSHSRKPPPALFATASCRGEADGLAIRR